MYKLISTEDRGIRYLQLCSSPFPFEKIKCSVSKFGHTIPTSAIMVRPNMEVMCIVISLKFEAVYIPFVYC